jgi:type IV pilus assembly protein PilW
MTTKTIVIKATTKQQGVTLVELMITLLLGLIITAGVIQIFISNKATYSTQEGIVQMNENMRFAFEKIGKDIRMAGFLGCRRSVPRINMAINGADIPDYFNPLTGIQGWDADGTGPGTAVTINAISAAEVETDDGGWNTLAGANNALKNADVVPDSDIIRAWFADSESTPILSINETTQSVTLRGKSMDVAAGDVLVFHDCESVDIAIACSVSESSGNKVISLAGCSDEDLMTNGRNLSVSAVNGEVSKLNFALYYIAKEGSGGSGASNPPALYLREISRNGDKSAGGGARELVRGVENMQVLYGIDTDSDGVANQYVTADSDELENWNSVVSVKISLLMSTLDNVPGIDSTYYNVNGTTVTPAADNRLRKVYTTTILLRNRTS